MGLALSAPIEDWQPPLGNLSTLQEDVAPPWVSSHPTRGTFEILYSCSFTLGLCVYTALHLNVPSPKGKKRRHFYLRKAKWALIALFGPEVILYTAWDQWCDAKQFSKEFNEILLSRGKSATQVSDNEKSDAHATVHGTDDVGTPTKSCGCGELTTRTNVQPQLTLADGFYAGMGGYVVNIPEAIGELPSGRYTLSRQWILALEKIEGYTFPIASRETIEDKSKANLLAKILVCFQVSFLVMQVGFISTAPSFCC